jgi:hypothetical protein
VNINQICKPKPCWSERSVVAALSSKERDDRIPPCFVLCIHPPGMVYFGGFCLAVHRLTCVVLVRPTVPNLNCFHNLALLLFVELLSEQLWQCIRCVSIIFFFLDTFAFLLFLGCFPVTGTTPPWYACRWNNIGMHRIFHDFDSFYSWCFFHFSRLIGFLIHIGPTDPQRIKDGRAPHGAKHNVFAI